MENVSYVFFSKYIQTLQVTGLKDERGSDSRYFVFYYPKFYGRHNESCSTGMTRNGLVLMSCLIVMFKVIQPFLEDEQKPKCGGVC
jgi:hypothetical protein